MARVKSYCDTFLKIDSGYGHFLVTKTCNMTISQNQHVTLDRPTCLQPTPPEKPLVPDEARAALLLLGGEPVVKAVYVVLGVGQHGVLLTQRLREHHLKHQEIRIHIKIPRWRIKKKLRGNFDELFFNLMCQVPKTDLDHLLVVSNHHVLYSERTQSVL